MGKNRTRLTGMLRYTGILIAMLIVSTIYAASAAGITLQLPKLPGLVAPTLAIYAVTYNGNGSTVGSVPVDSNNPYSAGETVTVLGNTGSLARTGYTFAGWNTAADGSGTGYQLGSTFTMGTASITLYAQWKLNILLKTIPGLIGIPSINGGPSWTDITGNGGFYMPCGVAVDGAGNVYVADSSHNMIKELTSGSTSWTDITGNGGFNIPQGVAADGAGNVYVLDTLNSKIKELPYFQTSWTDITGNGGFNQPYGVAADGAGNVYVADTNNSKIKELASATPGITSTAPSAATLQLTATGVNGSVILKWAAPSYSKTVTGFYPYRGTSAGGESSISLADFPVTGSSFTDPTAQIGITYYYILKPVFSDSSQGAASNEVSATATATIVLQVGNDGMTVNGVLKPIDSSGTVPVIVDSHVFVPISAIIQAMGGTATPNGSNTQVTITLGTTTIVLTIKSTNAIVNGTTQTMNVAPYISSTGRTMVPLSFVTGNLPGCTTNWDGSNKSVTISYT